METIINNWFVAHFCNQGLDSRAYGIAMKAKDALIQQLAAEKEAEPQAPEAAVPHNNES